MRRNVRRCEVCGNLKVRPRAAKNDMDKRHIPSASNARNRPFTRRFVPAGARPPGNMRPAPAGESAAARMVPVQNDSPLPWVQLRNAVFHPSIFRKMVGRMDPRVRAGDMVAVYDRDAKFFGTGLYNPQSQIALRMLTFDASPVSEETLIQRLEQAVKLRNETLKLPATTDAYRVVHAEGDGLPGLIVDRLGDYAVMEFFSLPMFQRRAMLEPHLKRLLGVQEVLTRADDHVQENEGFVVPQANGRAESEEAPARKSTIITENGIKFQVDLTYGHKTGFFCDQRDNRQRLTAYTAGAKVLDLCSYTGGFGLSAVLKGGADSVTAVDLDERAIALAQRNANINHVPRGTFATAHSDAFTYLRQMQQNGTQFDVVVLDPPKFIASREEFDEGRAKYFDLNKLTLGSVKSGGTFVTCSCSGLMSQDDFLQMVRGAARGSGRRVQMLEVTGPGCDHPVMTEHPESIYLKCVWARVW
jgi:23S rRNA (cytosine1962-C5)-methyltransferase